MLDVFDIPSPAFNTKTFIGPENLQGPSSWQTWVKPRGCSFIHIFAVGGGGGGGISAIGNLGSTQLAGGGAGGSGGQWNALYLANDLPDILYVAAGGGGLAPSSGGGTPGGDSTVAISPSTTGTLVLALAKAGNGGGFGNLSAGGAGGLGGTAATTNNVALIGQGSKGVMEELQIQHQPL